VSDLRDLPPAAPRGLPVTIDFEGERVAAFAGEPVAVALHAAGIQTLARSSKYHRPRGFFCLDGHCAACLLRIDGRPNQRACLAPARAQLGCARQNAFPSADVDLLAAADWLFPEGMDHHTMMTGSRAGNALFLKLVREMGGAGTLPDAPAATRLAPRDETPDVCIVGGGPAGLAAARAIAEAAPGAAVTLYDEQAAPGGSLHAEAGGAARAGALHDGAQAAGARLLSRATAIAFYPEDEAPGGGRGLLAVVAGDRLLRVRARRYLYATGGYDQNLPFADNDRPGVIAARACGRLAFHWGVRPVAAKRKVIILDGAPTAAPLEQALNAAGVATERIDLSRETVVGARGTKRVRGLDVASAGGAVRKVAGDLVAVATLPSPASELPRQHGAAVQFDPARGGFAAVVDAHGATTAEGVFACGDVTGYLGPEAAAREGTRIGRALAATLGAATALLVALALPAGCAAPEPPPAATPVATAPTGPAPVVEPPPFSAPPRASNDAGAETAETQMRRSILDAAWRTVRDHHYDKTLGGLDWNAVRAKYEPLALAAPTQAAFYRVLNQMIGELGQSHMMITGPGDEDEAAAEETAQPGEAPGGPQPPAAGAPGGVGDPGLTVRVIEGRPTITRVRAGSTAERMGLQPGFVVTQIGGRPIEAPRNSSRALRPVEERFAVRRAATRRLAGPPGTRVTVSYLDNGDRPGKAVLTRDPPSGQPVQIGYLPPIYPEVHAYETNDVGVIAFNIFFVEPVLGEIKQAVARFQQHHVRGIILDLRGNPGGVGGMSIPVASLFVDRPVALGTLKLRDFDQTFTAKPERGSTPYLGPLAILTDEGTASTSEMLAAGLQEAKRAVVVGDASVGAVLPSVVEALPGGAIIQDVVADFKTPKGVLLEGRGVQPDKRVIETRAGLRTGRDPVLDAALVAVRASRGSR
jgi:C-terminal processing protease CtpA/Prc/NADPH-dependent 2,4-dienoyl-CoA reductase/sulfur reductase-like enzyme